MAGDDRLGEALRGEPSAEGHPYCKSEFFRRPLPAEAIAALVEHLAKERVPGHSRELDFTPWGGAYNRVPADATAFVHRDELFLLQHAVVVDPGAPAAEWEAARRWLGQSWGMVHPWGPGECTRTSPTRTSRTGSTPTTGPTTTVWYAPKRGTIRTDSSASTNRSQVAFQETLHRLESLQVCAETGL